MIKEVENQFKVLDKQGIMNKKTKLCKCCDTTENEDGICKKCNQHFFSIEVTNNAGENTLYHRRHGGK
jgi:hypothetical protein